MGITEEEALTIWAPRPTCPRDRHLTRDKGAGRAGPECDGPPGVLALRLPNTSSGGIRGFLGGLSTGSGSPWGMRREQQPSSELSLSCCHGQHRVDTLLTDHAGKPKWGLCPDRGEEKDGPQSAGEPPQSCQPWPGFILGSCQLPLNLGLSCVLFRTAASPLSKSSLSPGGTFVLAFLHMELLWFNLQACLEGGPSSPSVICPTAFGIGCV